MSTIKLSELTTEELYCIVVAATRVAASETRDEVGFQFLIPLDNGSIETSPVFSTGLESAKQILGDLQNAIHMIESKKKGTQ